MARRRGAELDSAIQAAVLELLAEHGPNAVTMDAVAAAARTSKPVLYRRWPDRRALLRDTLLAVASTSFPRPDTGSFRGDLLDVLRAWAQLFTGGSGPLMRAAITAVMTDPELEATFRADVLGMRKDEMTALIRRGIERGEVRADVPVEIVRELGQSVLWHRLLISGDPITDELVTELVDEVLIPVTRPYYDS
ncbi:TetR/AcrR family transcriptional regulator [Mycolicibacterium parafortuitum]|uniref:TetR family transcriptional regulator [Saccharopolyspora erythraea NRRL 2338] n=1 Tax=Mycolicibacterium parafortuitum TaxID=39692 RepID=A0A375YLD9_MYCPF|nr:TetR/AcrR family transcriptional regulator [Mycolicibacterium parafortuitum]ORB30456.1 TetR family transcriptional regulator [Mycolicibacterium parafortuitum]SRX81853.1 TetR family transcriptional regulator [Saccharopolyspora erythraea NRRL 2338] [Mycolicibacterium parafortuitum]